MTVTKAEKLWNLSWTLLLKGQQEANHPYRTPVVCTVSPTLHPRSRTIVLRQAVQETGSLYCYTDHRSEKVSDLLQGAGEMSWTFWDAQSRVQLTGSGPTECLDQSVTKERFRELAKHARKAYATQLAPGTQLPQPADGLPADWKHRKLADTDYAEENFCILRTVLTQVQVLEFTKDGHRRLIANRQIGQNWQFRWVVP